MSDLHPRRPTAPPDEEATLVDDRLAREQARLLRESARTLAADGSHHRAFTELLKALRFSPSASLATEVLNVARRAGLEVAGAAALEEAWGAAPEGDRATFHRALARLWRRQGRLEQARLHLYQLLAESPGDVRAQVALGHILAREGRYQELAQALARAGAQASKARRHRLAHRAHLLRGRILSAPLGEHLAASDAFSQAAQATSDREAAVAARMLALRALAREPGSDRDAAARLLREAGEAAGSAREGERAAQVLAAGGGPEAARLLIERAVLAEARGAQLEAVALWEAALEANPAATDAAERLARLLTARKAWAELAEFRGRQAERSADPAERALALRQRAEILERHLKDVGGAAQAYAEIFRISADPSALLAQLDRLERAGGPKAADAALDRAVSAAADLQRKAVALRLRADRHLAQRRFTLAAIDLQRLGQLQPLSAQEQQRLCEAQAEEGDPEAIEQLWGLAQQVARGAPGRAELFRRLARLSAWPLGDAERSRAAWAEVLAEAPGDPEAEERLHQLARARNRPEELVPILESRAARLGRGPDARQARHDLARLLERLGRDADALESWQAAVRAEPADAVAQEALGERLEARGRLEEAAMAFESAAHGLDDARLQGEAWARLAAVLRKLGQPEPSARAVARAQALGVAVVTAEAILPVPRPPLRPADATTPEPPARPRAETRRRRAKTDPSRIPLARAAPTELLARLQQGPLEAPVHERLAEHFDRKGDVLRASLFTEVAHALEGDPDAEPLAPKGTLSATSRLALRHPDLRGPWVEALQLCGEALVAEGTRSRRGLAPFAIDAGKGASLAAQALLDAVRILGQRAPDVMVSTEDGPPFALEAGHPVRLTVGRGAIRKAWPSSELRFFAGRALYSLAPDLLALRLLDLEELAGQMQKVVDAVLGAKGKREAKLKGAAGRLNPKARERLAAMMDELRAARPDWEKLMLAARHSANRAGLLAAGGVAPSLRAMQLKRADVEELAELIRFAVSDRMVRIRAHRR